MKITTLNYLRKIFVAYRTITLDGLDGLDGTLEDVPENAVGAVVTQDFPIVGPDGEFKGTSVAFQIYIGTSLDFRNGHYNPEEQEIVNEFLKLGYNRGVRITSGGVNIIKPIRFGDRVVSSHQALEDLIAKINDTYHSVNVEFTDSQRGRDDVGGEYR